MLVLAQGIDIGVGFGDLWLPVLIGAVAVFIASSIIWMALPYHKADIRFLPDERAFDEAIKPLDIAPGLYMFPNCASASEMKSDAFKERFERGPWGIITIMPAKPNFGLNMLKTFLSYLVICTLIAYVAGSTIPAGAEYLHVFRVCGACGLLGFCTGGLAGDFFLGKPTRFVITGLIDGVMFTLILAGVFASMWPQGTPATVPGT